MKVAEEQHNNEKQNAEQEDEIEEGHNAKNVNNNLDCNKRVKEKLTLFDHICYKHSVCNSC